MLKENDVLLILGKGHEEFMIIGREKIPFNDKKVVLSYLEELSNWDNFFCFKINLCTKWRYNGILITR